MPPKKRKTPVVVMPIPPAMKMRRPATVQGVQFCLTSTSCRCPILTAQPENYRKEMALSKVPFPLWMKQYIRSLIRRSDVGKYLKSNTLDPHITSWIEKSKLTILITLTRTLGQQWIDEMFKKRANGRILATHENDLSPFRQISPSLGQYVVNHL